MPEVNQIAFTHKELTELMLRDQGIRSGHWMILTRFGQTAANIGSLPNEGLVGIGEGGPAVISVLVAVGIQKADGPGPLTVDASKIWRDTAPSAPKRKSPAK